MKNLASKPVGAEDICLLERGMLPPGGFVADKFQTRIVETVDAMLKRYVRKFNRLLNEALEYNEIETAQLLCVRLRREMEYCFFFTHIRFLEKEFTEELAKELQIQIGLFWKQELQELVRMNEQVYHPGLEDLIYSMRRMRRGIGV